MTSPFKDNDQKYLLQNYGERGTDITRGDGMYAWDSEGRKYLDCISGIAVNAFGHCSPPVVKAITEQSRKLIHGSNYFLLEPQQILARLLVENTHLDKAFFCNSGTEANEAAIKFARKYWFEKDVDEPKRVNIICLSGSFHGRTYGALSATGQASLKTGFGPMVPGFIEVPVNDCNALLNACDGGIAAIIFEPLLAEGGVLPLTQAFASVLKQVQDAGVLLIADEIQTGLGRLGYFLAGEGLKLQPDIVTLAKSLGGGLPLGAVLLKNHVAQAISAGNHGTTFGGNPVACAAGIEVIKQVLEPGRFEHIKTKSQEFKAKLHEFAKKHQKSGFCVPVKGQGLLLGIKYTGKLLDFIGECRERGLLICKAGSDVLRFLPPLNITTEQIEEVIDKLNQAVNKGV